MYKVSFPLSVERTHPPGKTKTGKVYGFLPVPEPVALTPLLSEPLPE